MSQLAPMILSLQYLENSLELDDLSPQDAAGKLRRALAILPITHVLVGWRVPPVILEACRLETERARIKMYRWQPTLCGVGELQPKPEWQTTGLLGDHVPGFRSMPEFTFVCPNNSQAVAVIVEHISRLTTSGIYQGLFLDRIRWPSPAANPLRYLGCFCQSCRQAAKAEGLDWVSIQKSILHFVERPEGRQALVRGLLGGGETDISNPESGLLIDLLDFRTWSITRFCKLISAQAREASLEVGLDCFSPGLTRMVGQDLASLSPTADWIKVMTYAHTLGPAGLPFELLGLLDFLIAKGLPEKQAISLLSQALGLPLQASRRELELNGLSPEALSLEIQKGVRSSSAPLLAGIELVEIAGVTHLHRSQIEQDGRAIIAAKPAGIALSWDLLHIPLERLEWVRKTWLVAH